MSSGGSRVLVVQETGETITVGFGDKEFPDEAFLERCREELDRLLEEHPCKVLAFDLTGVVIIPSTMLGLLLSLKQRGLEIRILNPSDEVRMVLEITRLNTRFHVEPPGP